MINYKFYPEDIDKDYSTLAIALPMNSNRGSSNSGIFNMSYTTEQQAISNYINLLLTKSSERFMQPLFGVGLQFYLFEQNVQSVAFQIETAIREQARIWLPYIINDSIEVFNRVDRGLESDPEQGINIVIRFRVTESGANRAITLFPNGRFVNVEVE